jgi:very-short-patch-repair endonuclease
LRRAVRARRWTRLRRAVFTPLRIPDTDTRNALDAAAAALAWPQSVVSHQSAAVLHGLPVLHRSPQPIVTVVDNDVTGQRSGTHARKATLRPGDVGSWFGVRVTTPARTAIDLGRHDRRAGLVAADAALRYHLTGIDELTAALDACRGWAGSRSAAWVTRHADALAESPLESQARAVVLDAALPAPELQVVIRDDSDGWRCRVDMLWRRQRVVLEADGRIKYGDRQALWAEKVRQERLERLGFRVIRVMWSDVIGDAGPTTHRLRALLAA